MPYLEKNWITSLLLSVAGGAECQANGVECRAQEEACQVNKEASKWVKKGKPLQMKAQRETVKCSPIKVWAKTNEGADEECVIECEIGCNNGVCKAVEASK